MKTKNLSKKLSLNKKTIANLKYHEKREVRGGYPITVESECYTWNEACTTRWPSCGSCGEPCAVKCI